MCECRTSLAGEGRDGARRPRAIDTWPCSKGTQSRAGALIASLSLEKREREQKPNAIALPFWERVGKGS